MVERPQWVCWRSEDRNGKQTKIPVEPETGSYASSTDPDTWRSFETASAYAAKSGTGLGFVFTSDDPLVGVDLDDCRDPETGDLSADATAIVSDLASFTEVSPSGTGVHVIVRGELPNGRNRRGSIELYDTARFFTVTGDQLAETPTTACVRPDALTAIHAEDLTPDESPHPSESESSPQAEQTSLDHTGDRPGNDLMDDELLERAQQATNGEKFDRLWRGTTAGYESHSEADMALCSLLAFWTAGDSTQIDRLFRQSGLLRPKWDEVHFSDGATYGERTIERSVAGTDDFYDPSSDTSWTLFETEEVQAESHTSTIETAPVVTNSTSADQGSVPVPALSKLRTELDALERENERLQQQLDTERARRKTAETELNAEREPGFVDRLLWWR